MIRQRMIQISRSRWAAAAWTVLIFLLMILPKSGIPNQGLFGIKHLDKLVHMVLFGLFVWFWHFRMSAKTGSAGNKLAWILCLVALCYGIAMEFVQHYFTDRDFDTGDILADALGALAITLLLVTQKNKPLWK